MEHPLSADYGPLPGWVILLLMFAVSGGFFGYQVVKASRLVLKGKPENRFDNWGARISEVLSGWLGQKKGAQGTMQPVASTSSCSGVS